MTRAFSRRIGLLLTGSLTVFFLILLAGPASAHAVLESSNPGNTAVLTRAPSHVTLTFNEPVGVTLGGIRVLNSAGQRVDEGKVTHIAGRGSSVGVSVRSGLPGGSYLVTWRVISADSHPVSGSYVFSIGAPGIAPQAVGLGGDRDTGLALGIARWLAFLGVSVAFGSVFFSSVVASGVRSVPAVGRLAAAGLGVTFVAAIAELLLQGPYEAGLPISQLFNSQLVSDVVSARFGHAVILRLVGVGLAAVLLLTGTILSRRGSQRAQSVFAGTALLALVLTAVGYSLSGHPGTQGPGRVALDVLHLLAVAIWLGGLLTLLVVVRAQPAPPYARTALLRRWSTTAAIAVLALVVTGVWAAWLEVRSLGALHTTYGRLLITKTALLALMLILANVARVYVRQRATGRADAAEPQSDDAGWHEQLRQGSLPPREGFPSLTFSAFRNSVAAETSIAAVVLAITALLVQTQPAKDAYAPIYDVTVKKFGAFVQTTVQPARPGTNQLHVFLTDGTGRAREVPEIRASFEMPDRGIAPIRTYIHRVGPGHWEDLRTSLPQAGKWQLHLTIRTSDIDEYSYDQTISVR